MGFGWIGPSGWWTTWQEDVKTLSIGLACASYVRSPVCGPRRPLSALFFDNRALPQRAVIVFLAFATFLAFCLILTFSLVYFPVL